ncbi:MAG: AAA family ATPase, partial [Lachnospiraceae bacterium]|nr:AAA family ATPase [Lachnospiraceae bacterium]
MATRELPLGNSDFQKIREKKQYYIDKTLFIDEFLLSGDEVTLITRPRRFGKTLNMSMLYYFCDKDMDSRSIFEGLSIMDTDCSYKMNTFPVIFISFKDTKQNDYVSLLFDVYMHISMLYYKYREIYTFLDSHKENFSNPAYKIFYRTFQYFEQIDNAAEQEAIFSIPAKKSVFIKNLSTSLLVLTNAVATYYNKKPILLIDEYDTPILTAYAKHYKREMGDFFTILYGSTLKDNLSLEKTLLTGIQRVAKENIFSGLNNLRVYNVLSEKYSSYFGLTEYETAKLLEDYGLSLNEAVRRQYNGYVFGSCPVYNPWSILNYAADHKLNNYWIGTSGNTLIAEALKHADSAFYDDFDRLASDKQAEIEVDIDMALAEIIGESTDQKPQPTMLNRYLWGLLINAGYLTVISTSYGNQALVRIPNEEVREAYAGWLSSFAALSTGMFIKLFRYMTEGDVEHFVKQYSNMLSQSLSYHDTATDSEAVYHALFLGMCMTLG